MKEPKEYKALLLPKDLHQRVKVLALNEKKTMIELIEDWVEYDESSGLK